MNNTESKSSQARKAIILIAAVVILAVLTVLEIYGTFDIFDNKLDGEFSVEDFTVFETMANPDNIQEYVYLGKVDNIATLKRQAQKIWIKKYGLDVRLDDKPYRVFYDSYRDVYLVTGTVNGAFGGAPNMLVEGETGLILNIWHDK